MTLGCAPQVKSLQEVNGKVKEVVLQQQDERKQLVSECEEMGRQLKVRSEEVELNAYIPSESVSLPELIIAIRGQIPDEKCDLLEGLVQKLQKRELRLNRQEFLHRVKDIAGDAAPVFRVALKQLAVDRRAPDPSSLGSGSTVERRTAPSEQASRLCPLIASDCASDE